MKNIKTSASEERKVKVYLNKKENTLGKILQIYDDTTFRVVSSKPNKIPPTNLNRLRLKSQERIEHDSYRVDVTNEAPYRYQHIHVS